jgi:hypothetical protein
MALAPFNRHLTAGILLGVLWSLSAGAADIPGKVTFNDHVLPIFRNACLNCHNPDKKKAGLDLSTYQGTIAGSDNGKVVESGNTGASLLFKCVKGTEEPKMPPKGDRLTDTELVVMEKWIAGQLLETANSKGIVASNNVQLAAVSLERPSGPPPMPGDLPLEPVVQPKAANALVALAASPWAPLVAVGGQKQIVLYNTESLQPLGVLPFPEGFPAVIRFSRNGQLLLTGGGLGGKSGQVALWEVTTGERAGTVGNEFDQVLGADISPNHASVALGGPSKVLKIYSTKDGKLEHSIKKHTDWVTAVAYSPDGKYLASADRSGGIVVWEGATGKEFNTLPGHKVMVTSLAFMPGILASASKDGTIVLWDVKEGKEIRKWNAHGGGVEWVDFTPDGRLVSCGRDKLAKAWDQTGKNLFTSAPFGDIALRAALNSERVVAGDWSGAIKVFALEGAKPLGELLANPPPLAQQLAAAEKRASEAASAIEPLEKQLAALEEKLRVETEQGTAALDQESVPDAAKKRVDELTKALQQQTAEVARLREERAKHKEGTGAYSTANDRVQVKKGEIAQTEAALASAKNPSAAPAVQSAAEQELAAAKSAIQSARDKVTAAQIELARWKRAQSFMQVHTTRETYAAKKARHEDLIAEIKDAFLPIEQMKAQISAGERLMTELPGKIAAAEKSAAEANDALEQLRAKAASTEVSLKEKAAAAKAAADARASLTAEVAELNKKAEGPQQKLANLQKAADELTAEITKRREARSKIAQDAPEYASADARVQEIKPKIAEATAAVDAQTAALAEIKSAIATRAAKQAELKSTSDAASAEIPKLREALDATVAQVKATSEAATVADKALAALRKESDANTKKLAELKAKLPEATQAATAAKAAAEKEAATLASQLDGFKIQAEKAKAQFEAKYRAPSQSAASDPATPVAKS